MLYREIKKCRICGNKNLHSILNLGYQALTGVFPKKNEKVQHGPLELVKCMSNETDDNCGLLQLRHDFDLSVLYGDNYGYRSGLNASMVKHLKDIVKKIEAKIDLKTGDAIIDIGSNDGTLLNQYASKKLDLIGIDPTIQKFKAHYPKYIQTVQDFFPSKKLRKSYASNVKVITSIAMFYDLEHPLDFIKEIYRLLAKDGVWVFEQSYMPLMIKQVAYDTICHEHLEYYAVKQIRWILKKMGMKIVHVETNYTNGGSFLVFASKNEAPYKEDDANIKKLVSLEKEMMLDTLDPYKQFVQEIQHHRYKLQTFLQAIRSKNQTVYGYGASTKGNVMLQYCNITSDELPFIAEVNEYKFGRYTPGTNIPIISEEEARRHKPDYFLVLPWHFRENILLREKDFLKKGGKLVFPLPKLSVV